MLNDRLDWNLLRTVLVIAREQSVSRAAAHPHITQPAVSHALRPLEEQLGRKLVQRSGPRIDITRAGNEVREIAEDICGSISRLASDEGAGEHCVPGQVRLITVSGVQSQAYGDFRPDYPDIDLDVQVMRSACVPSAPLQHTTTAAPSLNRHVGGKIAQQGFMPQRQALFCGQRHRLFGQAGLGVDDLRDENFVSFAGDQLGASLSVPSVFRDQHGLAERAEPHHAHAALAGGHLRRKKTRRRKRKPAAGAAPCRARSVRCAA